MVLFFMLVIILSFVLAVCIPWANKEWTLSEPVPVALSVEHTERSAAAPPPEARGVARAPLLAAGRTHPRASPRRRWHAARLAADFAREHGDAERVAQEGDTSGAATQQVPWLTLRILFEADADGGAPLDLLAPLPAARLLQALL